MPPPSLAVVIPTYRRPDILAAGLRHMADALRRHGVALYVSDDSPDDATQRMVEDFATGFGQVHYRRNRPAFGHDDNIIASLLWPTEDFVWIVGDAGRIEPDGLIQVLSVLDRQELLLVNSHAPQGPDVPKAVGEDARTLVRDLLWHQTLTGATIYGRPVLDWLRTTRLGDRGDFRNFPHLAILLDYLAMHPTTIGWVGTPATRFVTKTSYWRDQALSVFVDDWARIVRRQPDVIRPVERPAVLRSHSAQTGLFDRDLLCDLRHLGALRRGYVHGQPDFFDVMHLPRWKIELLLRLPRALLGKRSQRLT